MGLFGLPDPLADVLNEHVEKEIAKTLLSAAYSQAISGLWSSKVAKWLGLRDMATSTYLSLLPMVESGDLILTVPKSLLNPDNLAKFQTIAKK